MAQFRLNTLLDGTTAESSVTHACDHLDEILILRASRLVQVGPRQAASLPQRQGLFLAAGVEICRLSLSGFGLPKVLRRHRPAKHCWPLSLGGFGETGPALG